MLSFPVHPPRGAFIPSATESSSASPVKLAGLRVLLVEDEALVAMLIEDMLEGLGCEVLGPAAGVKAALALIEAEAPDAAVLDVNLGGEMVFPVADRLAELGVPYVFSTGYGTAGLEARHLGSPVLQKPYDGARLGAMLSEAVRRS